MIMSIPLAPIPSQSVDVILNQQPCSLNVHSRGGNLFFDLYLNNIPVLCGVVAHNRVRLVRDAYLGFNGDLAFVDLQGTDAPMYIGLGTRWKLYYFT